MRSLAVTLSLTAFVFCCSAAGTQAGDKAIVNVPDHIAVKPSGMLRLGDIASVDAPGDQAQRIAAVEIARAPAPGASREVSTDWIRSRLQCAGIDPAGVRLVVSGKPASSGSQKIILTGRSQIVRGADIAEAVRQTASAQVPASGSLRIEVDVDSIPSDIVAPEGSVEIRARARSAGTVLRSGRQWIDVAVVVDGSQFANVSVPVRLRVYGPVLTALRPITTGEALTNSNAYVEERELTGSGRYLSELPSAGGAVASRSIPAGAPIELSAVTVRPDIRKGDPVLVVVRSKGISVAVRGTAARDAAAGDSVRVVLPWSREEIQAAVVEPGLAEVRLR